MNAATVPRPAGPVRLLASDLDGTLFGPDHRVSRRTADAIDAARRAGIVVAAVTGRGYRGALPILADATDIDWAVCSNGGVRYDVVNDRLDERLAFDDEVLASIIEGLPRTLGDIGFGWERTDRFGWDARFLELNPPIPGRRQQAREAEPNVGLTSIAKLFIAHPDITHGALVDVVRPLVPNDVVVTTSGVPFIEITPPGGDKAAGLARLCEIVGVDREEVVAFGDNLNDVTMLRWAGTGIAMGNAIDETKAAADAITSTNADDGVAAVIDAILAS